MMYEVWLFNSSGDKVAFLENALSIVRKENENSAPSLEFSLPADDPKAVYLLPAYEAKIYNTKKARWEGIYRMGEGEDAWNSSGSLNTVYYSGALGQLERTENISYDTTVTPKTPTQIITALLALQEFTPAITVGTIQPTTSIAFAVENANLLGAILKLPEYLGGRIEVDASRALNFYTEPSTTTPTREVRYTKNMRGVRRKRNYFSLRNRIYAYGSGEGTAQIKLTDAGEPLEYIEDVPSQTLYGVCVKRITDLRITHPSTLLRFAQQYLASYKDPVISYEVDVVNLAAHSDFSFDYESLEVGQIIRVVNSDLIDPITGLTLNANVKVVSVDTNLSNAENISIGLSTLTKDLWDSFDQLQQYQNIAQNVACQISAGQVEIFGGVKVSGWASAGVTTIDGGKITANTITTSQLNFTPIAGGSVIATINSTLEDGFVIQANRITISGTTTFTAGYDPTSKTAKVGGTYDSAASGARVRIFPDANTGILITDGTNDVFKALVAGTDVGDVIIGDYAGGKGMKWDKSATTFYISGTIENTSLATSKTMTVIGAIQSTGFSVSPAAGWQLSGGAATFMDIDARGTVSAVTVDCSGTVAGNVLEADYRVSLLNDLADGSAPSRALYTSNGYNLHWKDKDGTVKFITLT